MTGRMPPGTGTYCPPPAQGVTYLKIGPRGNRTGMIKLEFVFQELFEKGHHPEQVSDQELVSQARKYNYIAYKTNIETDYAAALDVALERTGMVRE